MKNLISQNICCGNSKEPSQRDGSFEYPKQIFKLMGKKIITILHSLFLFICTCLAIWMPIIVSVCTCILHFVHISVIVNCRTGFVLMHYRYMPWSEMFGCTFIVFFVSCTFLLKYMYTLSIGNDTLCKFLG